MSYTLEDINDLLDKVRYDLTAAQAKISDLKTAVAGLPVPPEPGRYVCHVCGVDRKTQAQLNDHLALIHAGVT
jgi:hypothetical protein